MKKRQALETDCGAYALNQPRPSNIRALIARIGFWDQLYITIHKNKEPPK